MKVMDTLLRIFFSNFTITPGKDSFRKGSTVTIKLNEPWEGFVVANDFVRGALDALCFEHLLRLISPLMHHFNSGIDPKLNLKECPLPRCEKGGIPDRSSASNAASGSAGHLSQQLAQVLNVAVHMEFEDRRSVGAAE